METLLRISVECPNCGTSLMDTDETNNMTCIKLNIEDVNHHGRIRLCPKYLNKIYTTDMEIHPGKEYVFRCPFCKAKLNYETKCDTCSASMVHLHVKEGGFVRFCARAGCEKPSIEFDDLTNALEHFYDIFKFG